MADKELEDSDLRTELIRLREENATLRSRVSELEEQLAAPDASGNTTAVADNQQQDQKANQESQDVEQKEQEKGDEIQKEQEKGDEIQKEQQEDSPEKAQEAKEGIPPTHSFVGSGRDFHYVRVIVHKDLGGWKLTIKCHRTTTIVSLKTLAIAGINERQKMIYSDQKTAQKNKKGLFHNKHEQGVQAIGVAVKKKVLRPKDICLRISPDLPPLENSALGYETFEDKIASHEQLQLFLTPAPKKVDSTPTQEADQRINIIEFTEDSPFFQHKLSIHQAKVDVLSKRLKKMQTACEGFCSALGKMTKASEVLGNELVSDWSEIEGDVIAMEIHAEQDKNPVSLSSTMSHLSEMIRQMGQSCQILDHSLKQLLMNQLKTYRETNILQAFRNSRANMEEAANAYHSLLLRFLNRKSHEQSSMMVPRDLQQNVAATAKTVSDKPHKKKRGFLSSLMHKKKKGTEEDQKEAIEHVTKDIKEHLAELRLRFELARYDHVVTVNAIRTSKRQDLAEIVIWAVHCFASFFVLGSSSAEHLKLSAEGVNEQIQLKKKLYASQEERAGSNRESLEDALKQAISDTTHYVDVLALFPNPERRCAKVQLRGNDVFVEKQGYLRKQSNNIKKDWKRRWFSLEQGQLYYYRTSQDLTNKQFVVNVMVSHVRPNTKTELEHVFDIVSPNRRVYSLQAESEQDMKEWYEALQNCCEAMLAGIDMTQLSSTPVHDAKKSKQEEYKTKLFKMNNTCADCGEPEPDWASINLGIMMCIKCSGVHRQLGVHISKVRSVTLDDWSISLLEMMLAIGNKRSNLRYEGSEVKKIDGETGRDAREQFIRDKYEHRKFLSSELIGKHSENEATRLLMSAAAGDDIDTLCELYCNRADLSSVDPENDDFTALHYAAHGNALLATEYLIQNDANLQATDTKGNTPDAIAIISHSELVIERLAGKGHKKPSSQIQKTHGSDDEHTPPVSPEHSANALAEP